MGFIMDGLDAESYDRAYDDKKLLIRTLSYFRPIWKKMVFVGILIILGAVLNLGTSLLISVGIDSLVGNAVSIRTGSILIGAILVSGVLLWIIQVFRQLNTAQLVSAAVITLAKDAFDATVAHDLSFFDKNPSGQIVSRITSDTLLFSQVVSLLLNLFSHSLLLVLAFGILIYINIQLALFALALVPAILVIALSFRRIARLMMQQTQRILAKVNGVVQESISGIAVAKEFRQEKLLYEEFSTINRQSYDVNVRQNIVFGSIFPLLNLVSGIGVALFIYFGGLSATEGSISAGEWYFFLISVGTFLQPVTSIASFWSQFQQGMAASERVFSLIDVQPQVLQTNCRQAPPLTGRIEFKNIDFCYEERETVLTNFNLSIEAGETIALVGHTGAGKSSIVKLIARFYEFQRGQILIDGRDIRTFDLNAYRRQLGYVSQTPLLFSGTVLDNIRYARPEATEEDVWTAVKYIDDGRWIEMLPAGLETEIAEEGRGISMGQRQLVTLTRILLQNPAIVLLDEATASIDPMTEAQIQRGLETILHTRTAIVIAHRLPTIQTADRIIALHKGVILETGSHRDLLAQGEYYANLYNTYFRHQLVDYRLGQGFIPQTHQ